MAKRSSLLEKPEQRVRRAVRQTLVKELGFPADGWKEEVCIELYPGKYGYADFIVEEGGQPVIIIETKPSATQIEAGFRQARAYAILQNPERPIPYIWVATDKRHEYFELTTAPDCRSIHYRRIPELPSREELRESVAAAAESVSATQTEDFQRVRGILRDTYLELVKTHSPSQAWLALAQYWEYAFHNRISGRKIIRNSEIKALDRRFRHLKVGGRVWSYAFRSLMQQAFQGAGLGQYLTPIEVIEMMVSWANPRPGEKILDMAFGSGGFIGLSAYHLRTEGKASAPQINDALYGYDKECAYLSVARAFTALLLPDAPPHLPNLACADALRDLVSQREAFDVLLVNPPAEELPQKEAHTMQEHFTFFGTGKGRSTLISVAFLELGIKLLRPEGRIGILLPVSLLAGSEHRALREWLFQESLRVKAIIELPRGLFSHSKAASAMSIILGQKGKAPPGWKALLIQLVPRDMSLQMDVLRTGLAAAYA